jgi:hypothetical protein
VAGAGRFDVALALEAPPRERVARVSRELAEERPLCTAVPFSERMRRVQLGVVVGDPVEELGASEPAQMALAGECVENSGQIRLDVLGQREHAVVLRDRDGAQLARLLIDIAEDPAVKRL